MCCFISEFFTLNPAVLLIYRHSLVQHPDNMSATQHIALFVNSRLLLAQLLDDQYFAHLLNLPFFLQRALFQRCQNLLPVKRVPSPSGVRLTVSLKFGGQS